MPKKLRLWLAVAGLLMGACAPEVTLKDCYEDDECASDQRCTAGKCVAKDGAVDGAVGGPDAAVDRPDATADGPDAARRDAQVADGGGTGPRLDAALDRGILTDAAADARAPAVDGDLPRDPDMSTHDGTVEPPDMRPEAGPDTGVDADCPPSPPVARFGESRFGCGLFAP